MRNERGGGVCLELVESTDGRRTEAGGRRTEDRAFP
jgi:hypothetical protein